MHFEVGPPESPDKHSDNFQMSQMSEGTGLSESNPIFLGRLGRKRYWFFRPRKTGSVLYGVRDQWSCDRTRRIPGSSFLQSGVNIASVASSALP